MHTNRLKKIFAVILAAAMLLSITVIMTGCGDDKKDAKKETTLPTAAPTAAATEATVALTEAPAQATQPENSTDSNEDAVAETVQSTDSTDGSDEDADDSDEEKHGNITQGEAAQIALQNCEYGLEVTLADPAEYDGQDCWHVVVQDTAGRYYDCYVSSIFCEVTRAPVEDHDYGYDDGGEDVEEE